MSRRLSGPDRKRAAEAKAAPPPAESNRAIPGRGRYGRTPYISTSVYGFWSLLVDPEL